MPRTVAKGIGLRSPLPRFHFNGNGRIENTLIVRLFSIAKANPRNHFAKWCPRPATVQPKMSRVKFFGPSTRESKK